jgi:predicted anti-sigma-YlaC factor YlaD
MMGGTLREKLRWQLIFFLARRLPDCKTITPTLGEMNDRVLSLRERVVVKLHLFTCEACRRYTEQLKFLHEAFLERERLIDAVAETSDAELSSDAKDRIRKALSAS